jgi:hypothetical protein
MNELTACSDRHAPRIFWGCALETLVIGHASVCRGVKEVPWQGALRSG